MHEWIRTANGRTTVLLGAGASKPNLPTSAQLADIILDDLDARFTGEATFQRLWREISPVLRKSDNVESIFEAVEALGRRDTDPLALWVSAFAEFDFYRAGDEGRTQFRQDAEMLTHFIMYGVLQHLSARSVGAPLGHFQPLLTSSVRGIATLNYDTLLESAARRFSIPLSTGAEQWDGGFGWSIPEGSLPLLKIHGSFNWRFAKVLNQGTNGLPNMGIEEVADIHDAAHNGLVSSTVMFGGGVKLTPYGPFPALLREFERRLEESELIVTVGYGWADDHITQVIRRWATLDEHRRIIIAGPAPRITAPMWGDLYGSLLHALWDGYRDPEGGVPGYATTVGPNRIEFIREGVETALARLFG